MKYINDSFIRLKRYCENRAFQGWDPYDGLNSAVFNKLPLGKFALCRLLWIQFFKRSPVNLRKMLIVPQEYNPKGLALFLSGYSTICKIYNIEREKDKIDYLGDFLASLCSKGYKHFCWGYNFDWQSRTFFVPKYTPNVIVSTFAANAFLDAYEILKKDDHFKIARSVCDFILEDLKKTYVGQSFCFSYTPGDNSRIYNASLLASRLLARMYSFTKEEHLKDSAKRSIDFCVANQNSDGSWFYGADENQKWVDNFHTAYNLEALYDYRKYTSDDAYWNNFDAGMKYYTENFFTEKGIPKFYPDSAYPVDIHSTAAFVSFLAKTDLFEKYSGLIEKVLIWTISNMQDKEGYFYYQVTKHWKIKTPYMRWAQAWMFYALSLYLLRTNMKAGDIFPG